MTESADKRDWLLHFVRERVNDIVDTIAENCGNKKLSILNPKSTPNMNKAAC